MSRRHTSHIDINDGIKILGNLIPCISSAWNKDHNKCDSIDGNRIIQELLCIGGVFNKYRHLGLSVFRRQFGSDRRSKNLIDRISSSGRSVILTFILPDWGNELTFLYTAKAEDLPLPECAEGVLQWVPMDRVMRLPLWEGDRVFLPLLQSGSPFFSMKLIYAPGGVLLETSLSENPEA